jgi:hypothetical protein
MNDAEKYRSLIAPRRGDEPFQALRRDFVRKYPQFDSSNTWYINVYGGIGDALAILGHLREFRRVHQASRIILLSRQSLSDLLSFYGEDFDAAIWLENDFPLGPQYGDRFEPNSLICSSKSYVFRGAWIDFAVSNRIPVFDWFKFGLRLPMNAAFRHPGIPRISHDLERKLASSGLAQSRSVILFPYTNFGPRLSLGFWERLADALLQSGYNVFTNIRNSNTNPLAVSKQHETRSDYPPIQGTKALSCGIADVVMALEFAGFGLFGSGGMAFLGACTAAFAGVIYADETWVAADIDSTCERDVKWGPTQLHDSVKRSLPNRPNLHEFVSGESVIEEICAELQRRQATSRVDLRGQ